MSRQIVHAAPRSLAMAVGAAAYNHLHKDENSGLTCATRCFVEAVQDATKSFIHGRAEINRYGMS